MKETCSCDSTPDSRPEQCVVDAIYDRLRQWGGSSRSTRGEWIPANKVRLLQELVRDYVETYNLERDLLDQLPGWTCALGQIINIDDARIVTKLPYIFTAYIYNFGEPATVRDRKESNRTGNTTRNRYIYSYLQKIEDERKDFRNDEFFGVNPADNTPKVGIGSLLNGDFHYEDCRQRPKLKTLASNFVFPETAIRHSAALFPQLVPTDNLEALQARCEGSVIVLPNGCVVQDGIEDNGRILLADTFWNVFLSWCYTLLKRREQGCQMALKVDFLDSTCLMYHALHQKQYVNLIKAEIANEGKSAVQEWIEKQLISQYEKTREENEQATKCAADSDPETSDCYWNYHLIL